jgi:hypothetical protein
MQLDPMFHRLLLIHIKQGKLGAPRWNSDNTKVLVKYELAIADGTLDQVASVSGITALSHSECLAEMKKDEWSGE